MLLYRLIKVSNSYYWHLLCSFIGSLYQNGNILNNGEFLVLQKINWFFMQ
ncbi:hypothetical protein RPO_01705 [Rickettsia rickettsii str. Arizona]|uniref:Uncharacterized protein n=4 Tax=spotted fever group TaxID=114277 RepID=B0BWN6_RICRO|nr:hypothetical protein RrIowa_0366 [Rickettsia rickettsii str. Iowa]AFB22523.1 hypothetical protein RPN_05200 [Rickettsia rickettsii str. Brazil]AFB23241.1 hypothetical protein RPL_01700 [Rickettsia rickettsii str. Colombia]AFB24593.1 hypothetical protein RPO_01705 [Rickettsia rickettsii str. Arizona]AFB25929.1 hypothetical protein RSA_01665 [Rickettsia philipii str. 364D]AFB27279.1 hypothetical protein RPJ_01690 [Rickettsia rickettsii str. Hino]AFB28618.1 hypothetical protein RPK_01675 [Ric